MLGLTAPTSLQTVMKGMIHRFVELNELRPVGR
jgi:hypothetical protein